MAAVRAPGSGVRCGGKLVPIPINRTTLNRLYDLDLRSDEEPPKSICASRAEPTASVRTF